MHRAEERVGGIGMRRYGRFSWGQGRPFEGPCGGRTVPDTLCPRIHSWRSREVQDLPPPLFRGTKATARPPQGRSATASDSVIVPAPPRKQLRWVGVPWLLGAHQSVRYGGVGVVSDHHWAADWPRQNPQFAFAGPPWALMAIRLEMGRQSTPGIQQRIGLGQSLRLDEDER